MASAEDVPLKYDVVLNGEGYCFYRPWTGGDSSNAPQLGIHSFSPSFIPRTNTENTYGDNQQDFYLTVGQKDWSLGEQQRHALSEGATSTSRYWDGSNVNVTKPGRVFLRPAVFNVDLTEAATSMCAFPETGAILVAEGSTLYSINEDGTESSLGAHGLGAAVARGGMCSDGANAYLTTEEGGTVGVRKWTGAAFSTFSATGSSAIAYLNNTLFGLDKDGIFRRYNTAGVASTLYTFQGADGVALNLGTTGRLQPYGGKLLILLPDGNMPSLWIYDGVGVGILYEFPANFSPHDIEIVDGVVFISGWFTEKDTYRPSIYYYANGQVGKLWQSNEYQTTGKFGPALAAFGEFLAFTDSQNGRLMAYDPTSGGVSSVGTYTANNTLDQMLEASDSFLLALHGGGSSFQSQSVVQSSGIMQFTENSPRSVSWPAPTTAGNTLLLAVWGVDSVGGSFLASTPTGWTLVDSTAAGLQRLYIFKIEAASSRSGAQSIAWTTGEAIWIGAQLVELAGTGIVDKTETAEGQSTTASTGTTATTAQAEEIWVSFVGWYEADVGANVSTPSSPSDSFGELLVTQNTEAGLVDNAGIASYFKTVGATATASMSLTLSDNSYWGGGVVTLKAKGEGEGYLFPDDVQAVGGTIVSSLFDFDNSLNKVFSDIHVDFDEATDGDGGSVDIAYRLENLDGGYTVLQEDAVTDTSYPLVDIVGNSISVRITLNKGTSTYGPVLKRVRVRAAPFGSSKHRALLHLDCTDEALDNVGMPFLKSGHERAVDLRTAAMLETPITFTDTFDTMSAVIDVCELTQIRPSKREYVAQVTVRET